MILTFLNYACKSEMKFSLSICQIIHDFRLISVSGMIQNNQQVGGLV